MSNNQQVEIEGETVTWGDCDNPKFAGKRFVTIGNHPHHTTFIVDADFNIERFVTIRGNDRYFWGQVAIAITTEYVG